MELLVEGINAKAQAPSDRIYTLTSNGAPI
jgi:hypothetical protein